MKIKPAGKIIILLLVLGFAIGAYRMFGSKLAPDAKGTASVKPTVGNLPQQGTTNGGTGGNVSMPSNQTASNGKPEVRFLIWEWNAQMGALFANGGAQTTEGSLMAKHGVNLHFTRQDDTSKMQEELLAFATALSQGEANPSKGTHFIAIMGDGGATFMKTINDKLKRLGADYTARVVGTVGYSRGEDKFMGLPAWKTDPNASRGGVVAGVLRDGDWNIAQKWLGDNGLANNPDEKTYDPDALNWVAANDYLDAAEKYITGYSEDRPVVRNGKRTGQTQHITVNGVVTWTPGDVNVAQKKGGLVNIVSTKEYNTQMPCIIIGINKWLKANRSTVEGMLAAFLEGGDAVKSSPDALHRASEISAAVYNDQDAAYWEKYYRGVTEKDAQGLDVELGGSSVNNLADALVTFGMVPGSQNLFAATYTVFGDVVKQQYPDILPTYPAVNEILDTSYLQAIARKSAPTSQAVARVQPKFTKQVSGKRTVIGRRNWNIQFNTGRAEFTPAAQKTMAALRRDLLIASGTYVEIYGHTDNVGDPNKNMRLSEDRAFAVKKWLEKQSALNFPANRIQVYAKGQQNPLESNSTEAGRAKNRRVEIVLKSAGA